jgi:hypothetical protein
MSDGQPAQKRSRLEAQELPTHSEEFPEGYGDFVFKSMDGVTFHFPLLFLSHVSPVLKDMCQTYASAPNQGTMIFPEDYKTVEYFLCHIDPAKRTPELDCARIVGTLRAAEKYQVNNILHWFEKEVSTLLTTTGPPVLPNPMLCFILTHRYNLYEAAKLTLRELIRCPFSKIVISGIVNSRSLQRLFKLRLERTQFLIKIIGECPDLPYQHGNDCHTRETPSIAEWKKLATGAVVMEPSWLAIVTIIQNKTSEHRFSECRCQCGPLDHVVQRRQVEKVETTLPELSGFK